MSSPSTTPFRKFMLTEDMRTLRCRNPFAFVVMSVIAERAQWKDQFNQYDLAPGEALLGDCRAYGLTRRQYRTAMKDLARWGFATFQTMRGGRIRGTIGRITDSRVFDLNIENSTIETATGAAIGEPANKPGNIDLFPRCEGLRGHRNDHQDGHCAAIERPLSDHDQEGIRRHKKAEYSARTNAGGKNGKDGKYAPDVHERAKAIFELLVHFAQEQGVAFAVNPDSREDWRHLHNLAMKVREAGEVADLASWAWGTHKASLAGGRSDFVLEQSLTCRGLDAEFGKLLEKKRAGYRPANGHALAKANTEDVLRKQQTSQRITLDKAIAEWGERLRELNETLSLGGGTEQERAEWDGLKKQITEAKDQRRVLLAGLSQPQDRNKA